MALTTWNEPNLSAAERATLRLRGLYEQFGYKKYHLGQFEEYGLYLQFKRFLTGGRILSFTDLDGRLLALKPDVTLSIAKNARLDGGAVKAYYIENVYRESVSSGAMKEISQMGLEYLGGCGGYAQAEVLGLARETLAAVGPEHVLEVSHMGFLLGLFDALGLGGEVRAEVLKCLSAKSAHGVEAAARKAGIGPAGVGVLHDLCTLSGGFDETLNRARGLCLNGRMTAALLPRDGADGAERHLPGGRDPGAGPPPCHRPQGQAGAHAVSACACRWKGNCTNGPARKTSGQGRSLIRCGMRGNHPGGARSGSNAGHAATYRGFNSDTSAALCAGRWRSGGRP